MHTDSLKHFKAYDYTLSTAGQFVAVIQTKPPYDVKLAQKYWRQTSPKSDDFSIYSCW